MGNNGTIEQVKMTIGQIKELMVQTDKQELQDALKVYRMVRNFHDDLADCMKELKKHYDFFRSEQLPDRFQAEKVDSIKVDGTSFASTAREYTSINPAHKVEAFDWLRQHNLGELIVENVNTQSLSSAMREFKEEQGIDPDDELFNTYSKRNIRVTNLKGSG
jgi:hypothetical protein